MFAGGGVNVTLNKVPDARAESKHGYEHMELRN